MGNKEFVILVTGASSGIGFDTARTLARQGHRVYAAARRVALMEPLRSDGVVPLPLDVTDQKSMELCVKSLLDAEGRIDVLVNNAGYGYFGAIENVSMEEARRQMEVNVFGLAQMCKLVIPVMREQKRGRIINTSSIAGKMVLYFGGWYHVSKFSVEAFSDALRMEMKPFGIDVSIIEPGGIKTDWGIIAANHLADCSAGTPYEHAALGMADMMRYGYSGNLLSSPSVVTRAISRAVNSRRPRPRYRIGRASHALVFLHRLLPVRWWDALMRRSARIKVKKV
ncbi:MAG: SDR family NAD(P)-dependent oxidoreductase [Bacteroidales bacterium]|nr:SDR family NAD(P)-dependent oxidoreductase [Bacteroidales bacterium]